MALDDYNSDLDQRVRLAAFDWLSEQVAIHGDVLPRSILLEQNQGHSFLSRLAKPGPLKNMKKASKGKEYRNSIRINFDSRKVFFWPLYQPARSKSYDGDDATLRRNFYRSWTYPDFVLESRQTVWYK